MKQIVIGTGFGDEGKGLVTDWLARFCAKDLPIVRYSGGHQVGHCVRHNVIRNETTQHIFSNFGSGTMYGLPTIWNAKTCDPVGFCREYDDLISKGITPQIKINPNTAVTTPYDKIANMVRNSKLDHGTMGVGFGTTIEREENHYHLYFQDLFHPVLLNAKFNQIAEWYADKDVFINQGQTDNFFQACKRMITLTNQDLKEDPYSIYESSQGLMLDMEYGIFPYVTRSKVGTQEIDLNPDDELYLVTRAYQTRHGNGWLSRHGFKPQNTTETNCYNEFQGDFKTRLLDLDLLIYSLTIDKGIRESENRNLVITCIDHLNETIALTHNGERQDFYNTDNFIGYIVKHLPDMNQVFISNGPTARDIKEWT